MGIKGSIKIIHFCIPCLQVNGGIFKGQATLLYVETLMHIIVCGEIARQIKGLIHQEPEHHAGTIMQVSDTCAGITVGQS